MTRPAGRCAVCGSVPALQYFVRWDVAERWGLPLPFLCDDHVLAFGVDDFALIGNLGLCLGNPPEQEEPHWGPAYTPCFQHGNPFSPVANVTLSRL